GPDAGRRRGAAYSGYAAPRLRRRPGPIRLRRFAAPLRVQGFVVFAALSLCGCAGTFTSLTKSSLLSTGGNAFSVQYAPGLEGDVAASKRALQHAAPRLA